MSRHLEELRPGRIDALLDRSIVLGYSSLGYRLRRSNWSDAGRLPRLEDRTVVLTGATSGLGRAAAGMLAGLGARLILLVRSIERGEAVAAQLRGDARVRDGRGRGRAGTAPGGVPPAGAVSVMECDLSDLTSVRRCASALLDGGIPVDVLINNAGVMTAQRTLSADGIELTFATNVAGPFLLTMLLEPALAAAPVDHHCGGRVIMVSSGGMYGQRIHTDDLEMTHEDFRGVTAYARSKRAQVILTGMWAERWRPSGIGVHAMHPGWADTEGVASSLPRFRQLTRPLLRSPAQGADTIVWLAGSDAGRLGSGDFWHDRARRPTHLLARTRETPAEREALWSALCALTGVGDRA